MVLNQDVMSTVYEYLFGTKQPQNQELVKAKTPEDEHRKRRWFQAVFKGDAHIVAQLLGEDPNRIEAVFRGSQFVGSTALHIAAAKGYTDIVKQLVAVNPSKVDVADPRGVTALHLAAYHARRHDGDSSGREPHLGSTDEPGGRHPTP